MVQAAGILGLSRSTIYSRIAEGRLMAHKDGRRTFILSVELNRYPQSLAVEQ